eukprot:m.410614 g.410614  ORF g.410614 m.410614 type:complete len:515 (+) comp56539_c0_seq16:2240-3784(+)
MSGAPSDRDDGLLAKFNRLTTAETSLFREGETLSSDLESMLEQDPADPTNSVDADFLSVPDIQEEFTEPETAEEPPAAPPVATVHAAVPVPNQDDVHLPDWIKHEKHAFILSAAGKPIYSRFGDEEKLATIIGVMQALVSFVQTDDNNTLRYFAAGKHKFVFQVKDPIILVIVACTGESETHLSLQLSYLYNQIMFLLSLTQLQSIFEKRRNFDLRRMISGSEKVFGSLLDSMDCNPQFWLGAVRCLRLPCSVRDRIGQILQRERAKDLVFAILVCEDGRLVNLLRPKKFSLHPSDLHLVFNLIASSTSFKSAESWTPLCLPKFDSKGFLHAHISYIDEGNTCLLLLSNKKDNDTFFSLSNSRARIMNMLQSTGLTAAIADSLAKPVRVASQVDMPELRHYLYKSKWTAQFTAPPLGPPYVTPQQQSMLFRHYQFVHTRMHSQTRPLKYFFHTGPHEAILAQVSSGAHYASQFELYAVFEPMTTKAQAVQCVEKLLRAIRSEEEDLFILNAQVF